MVPLWTKGGGRTAPKAQYRKLISRIPEAIRQQVKLLYPQVPWLASADEGIARSSGHGIPKWDEKTVASKGNEATEDGGVMRGSRKRTRYGNQQSGPWDMEATGAQRLLEGTVVKSRPAQFGRLPSSVTPVVVTPEPETSKRAPL